MSTPIAEDRMLQLQDAHYHLERLARLYEHGDRYALLHAVDICARFELVIPTWAARAFSKAFRGVHNAEIGSWDDAFGRPWPKGKHLGGVKRRRLLRLRVWNEIHKRRARAGLHLDADGRVVGSELPIDEGLFVTIGREFGISSAVAKRLYYEVKDQLAALLPPLVVGPGRRPRKATSPKIRKL